MSRKDWYFDYIRYSINVVFHVVVYSAISKVVFGDYRYGFFAGLIVSEILEEIQQRCRRNRNE